MNKKEKKIAIASLIFIILLFILLSFIFIDLIFKTKLSAITVIAFVPMIIIGYVVIAILKINTYTYVCETCKNEQKLSFYEYIFSKKLDNDRMIECKKCKKIKKFIRTVK